MNTTLNSSGRDLEKGCLTFYGTSYQAGRVYCVTGVSGADNSLRSTVLFLFSDNRGQHNDLGHTFVMIRLTTRKHRYSDGVPAHQLLLMAESMTAEDLFHTINSNLSLCSHLKSVRLVAIKDIEAEVLKLTINADDSIIDFFTLFAS